MDLFYEDNSDLYEKLLSLDFDRRLASEEEPERAAPVACRADAKGIGLLLLPGYSEWEFQAIAECLEAANAQSPKPRYRVWHHVWDGTACGVLPETGSSDCLILLGGTERGTGHPAIALLRRHYRHGGRIAAASSGVLALIRAGLLDGRRCAVHWRQMDAARELSDAVSLSLRMVETDGRCLTAAGGVAALDLALSLIAQDFGTGAAQSVAEVFCRQIADPAAHQPVSIRNRIGTLNRHLIAATKVMAENMETKLSRHDIAEEAGVSVRQLERLFQKYLGTSPLQFYKDMRLRKARQLLRDSDLSITEIAIRTGHISPSHFAHSYRKHYGVKPSRER
ncbi:MAG: helix-turn-helix domain-containing protein [Pseudomonadota bacterium]|nr:helix-turn-helix domain-containing protein [Pseudomonadota bacterium]